MLPFFSYAEQVVLKGDQTVWDRKNNRVEALGNAEALRQDVTLKADTLHGEMEAEQNKAVLAKSGQFKRVDALGNVRIVSNNGTLLGEKGFYDLKREYMELTGKTLTIALPEGTFYTTKRLSYLPEKRQAFLKYKPFGLYENYFLKANEAELTFLSGLKKSEQNGLHIIEASGDVMMVSPGDDREEPYVVSGEKMRYDATVKRAELRQNIVLAQDENTLSGSYVESDLESGEHTLVQENGSVFGLFYTKKKGEKI